MQKTDHVRLHHIVDAGREAITFSQGRSRADLDTDRMLQLSLVRLLEIIGEATKGLSPEFWSAHTTIPWRKMSGMRDRLIHAYFDINLDIVWETVRCDLPPLVKALEKIISPEHP